MNDIELNLPELPYSVEEALNRLRVNIKFGGSDIKKIMVTSSFPGEGKSTISFELWRMLAQSGFKSLYLDLDIRNSKLAFRYFKEKNDQLAGVESYISGLSDFEDVIYQTNVNNGFIIPCINCLKNPSFLFGDRIFETMMTKLEEYFRYVIVDTPPLIGVSDGKQIASFCDAALLVVRSGYTSKNMVRNSLQQLADVDCDLLGIVLNRIPSSGIHKGYGYGYGYGYGHGYGYGYGYGQNQK